MIVKNYIYCVLLQPHVLLHTLGHSLCSLLVKVMLLSKATYSMENTVN